MLFIGRRKNTTSILVDKKSIILFTVGLVILILLVGCSTRPNICVQCDCIYKNMLKGLPGDTIILPAPFHLYTNGVGNLIYLNQDTTNNLPFLH